MKYKNGIQLLLLFLSLSIGAAGTYLCAGKLPVCSPAPMAQLAWWGGVYPEYCLPGAVKLVGEEETAGTEEEIPVKVRFKYLTFLNEND
ncbi:MAG: hypothetical protein HFI28_07070 [Lachnospiraceae bacterium]|nr:hypothetical protein [Lachnospiraceae bacterium]